MFGPDRKAQTNVSKIGEKPAADDGHTQQPFQRSIASFPNDRKLNSGVLHSARERIIFNSAPMFLVMKNTAGRAHKNVFTKADFRIRGRSASKPRHDAANPLQFTAQHTDKPVYVTERYFDDNRQMFFYHPVSRSVEKVSQTAAGTEQAIPADRKVISEIDVPDSAGSRGKKPLRYYTQEDLKELTNKVYHMLERNIEIEMERRGL